MPIIAPVKQKNFQVEDKALPTNYSDEFLAGLMNSSTLTRNVAVAGHLHHGKTVVSCKAPFQRQMPSVSALEAFMSFTLSP